MPCHRRTYEYNSIAPNVYVTYACTLYSRNVAYYSMHECKIRFQFHFNTICWRLCVCVCVCLELDSFDADTVLSSICPARSHIRFMVLQRFLLFFSFPFFPFFVDVQKDIIRFMCFFFSIVDDGGGDGSVYFCTVDRRLLLLPNEILRGTPRMLHRIFSVSIMPIVCFVCNGFTHLYARRRETKQPNRAQQKKNIRTHSIDVCSPNARRWFETVPV